MDHLDDVINLVLRGNLSDRELKQVRDFTGLNGESVLHHFAIEDNACGLMLAAKAGINPDKKNRFGKTALMEASGLGMRSMVHKLLEIGASPCVTDAEGNSALHHAYMNRAGSSVIDLLLEYGADPSLGNHYGELPHEAL